jgi:hypothetical protein
MKEAGFSPDKTWSERRKMTSKDGSKRNDQWEGLAGMILGREEWFKGWVEGEISCESSSNSQPIKQHELSSGS